MVEKLNPVILQLGMYIMFGAHVNFPVCSGLEHTEGETHKPSWQGEGSSSQGPMLDPSQRGRPFPGAHFPFPISICFYS